MVVEPMSFQMSALPEESTAQQLFAEGHDTEVRLPPFGSISRGFDQACPFQPRAVPLESTAMQKFAEGHDTEVRRLKVLEWKRSMDWGLDQLVPS